MPWNPIKPTWTSAARRARLCSGSIKKGEPLWAPPFLFIALDNYIDATRLSPL
jgi:hypothetical protein